VPWTTVVVQSSHASYYDSVECCVWLRVIACMMMAPTNNRHRK
jgi:hypothetical protein